MIGHRKNKWTKEEEKALLAGIAKHGAGNWMNILEDQEFSARLVVRNNINLKDKWRNIKNRSRSIKEESKTQTLESSPNVPNCSFVKNEPSPDSSWDTSNAFRYDALAIEAISTINDENGADLSEILSFVEERYKVPQNFRKLLSDTLRTLVSQDKLGKVVNRYKILDVKKKVLEETAEVVARKLAESENKEFIAAEAVKDAKRMIKSAEESRMMLQLCLETHEQCALGKKVYLR